MLEDFDALALAELDDIVASRAVERRHIKTPSPTAQAQALVPNRSAWAWLIGLGVLGLIVLAARR